MSFNLIYIKCWKSDREKCPEWSEFLEFLLWALLAVIMLQAVTYKHTQPGFVCQHRVWRGSTFPDPNHFCQANNYQLAGKPDSALIDDHSSQMFPGNSWLKPHGIYCSCSFIIECGCCVPLSPLQPPCQPVLFVPLPVLLMFFFLFLCLSL